MNIVLKTGTVGLAGLVTTGLIAWQAPTALAHDGSGDRSHHSKAIKRDDDGGAVVTTTSDDDDDDTGLGNNDTNTNTNTNMNSHRNTNTVTRGGVHEHSHGGMVRDMTNDGPGKGNVDHSRHQTNDKSRHNTRG